MSSTRASVEKMTREAATGDSADLGMPGHKTKSTGGGTG